MTLRKLITVLLTCGLFLFTPMAVTAASADSPYPPPTAQGSGSVSPSRVQAGGCVTFTGTGFEPNTVVVIRDNGHVVGTARADSNGKFTKRVCFGASAQRGRHILTGTGSGAGGGELVVSATVFIMGVSQRPGGAGGGLPFTGFEGSGIALGGILLVGVGSALLLETERRHRMRRRTRRVPA